MLELLSEKNITGVRIKRLGIPDEFVEHATQAQLRQKYGIDEDGIFLAVKEMLEINGKVVPDVPDNKHFLRKTSIIII